MAQTINHDAPRLTWLGVVSKDVNAERTIPWRLPREQAVLFHPNVAAHGEKSSGMRIAFYSDTGRLAGEILADSEARGTLDLWCDDEFFGSIPLENRTDFAFEGLPTGKKLLTLWLPSQRSFGLKFLSIDDGASVEPFQDDRPKWITYGSSITHCYYSQSSSWSWPAIVSREAGLNLTSLGFSGQCQIDTMVALTIRGLPADFISLKLGINVHGNASLSQRTFRSAIIGFAKIVREGHPRVPLVIISPIVASEERSSRINDAGLNLPMMRDEVAEAVRLLREYGDENVHYVDGLELMGPDDLHLLPDGVHPYAEGDKLMGRRFADKVARKYFL